MQASFMEETANQESAYNHKPANHSPQKLWAAEPSRSSQKQLKAAVEHSTTKKKRCANTEPEANK